MLWVELGVDDRSVEVSFAVADLVRVAIDPRHRLNRVSARLELGERTGKAVGRGDPFAAARLAASFQRSARRTAAAGTSRARIAARHSNWSGPRNT